MKVRRGQRVTACITEGIGLVSTLEELDLYPWCGHAVVLGQGALPGQVTTEALARFGKTIKTSRRGYRAFVEDGIAMGRRNGLIGSGQQRRRAMSDRLGEDLQMRGSWGVGIL